MPAIAVAAVAPVWAGGHRAASISAVLGGGGAIAWLIGWAVIGARSVVVDSAGLEQRSLFGRRRLAWRDVIEYRYRPQRATVGSMTAVSLLRLLDLLRPALIAGLQPRLWIKGGGTTISIDVAVYGPDGRRAIARVLTRVDTMIRARIEAELAETGAVRFGPLTMSRQAIAWAGREPVARDQIESIELFDTQPVQLRVMKRDKAWPYGRVAVERIPNALAALSTARALGYHVPERGVIAHPGR